MGIVNAGMLAVYDEIDREKESVVLNKAKVRAKTSAYAEKIKDQNEGKIGRARFIMEGKTGSRTLFLCPR